VDQQLFSPQFEPFWLLEHPYAWLPYRHNGQQ